MAISQPVADDALNSPDHSLMHRQIATDPDAPIESLTIDSDGITTITALATPDSSAYGGSLYNLFRTSTIAGGGIGGNLYTNFTYAFAADDLPFSIISRLVNSGTTVATSGAHGGAGIFWAEDTATVNATHMIFGIEGRVDAKGTNTNYIAINGLANWLGNDTTYNGFIVGNQAQVTITQTDGSTPLAQGTAISFFAPAIVGGASKFSFLGIDPIKTLSSIYSFDSGGTKSSAISHDGTDGYLTSSAGHLRLFPEIGSFVIAHSTAGFVPTLDGVSLGISTLEWGTAFINQIKSDTGTVDFDNENLTTTGTVTGKLITSTAASDPKHETPGSRPAGTVGQIIYYTGKLYFCTNSSTPTWELITSS